MNEEKETLDNSCFGLKDFWHSKRTVKVLSKNCQQFMGKDDRRRWYEGPDILKAKGFSDDEIRSHKVSFESVWQSPINSETLTALFNQVTQELLR